nr:MAG TPA: hypothetical protein [Caudoviricetes sp.]
MSGRRAAGAGVERWRCARGVRPYVCVRIAPDPCACVTQRPRGCAPGRGRGVASKEGSPCAKI